MINRVERRTRAAICTSCGGRIPKYQPYFRTQHNEDFIGPQWGRNFCRWCMIRFTFRLVFAWFFDIYLRKPRNIKEAKRRLMLPYGEVEP